MLKKMCRKLACKNIAVNIVSAGIGGLGEASTTLCVMSYGIIANASMNASVFGDAEFLEKDGDVRDDERVGDERERRRSRPRSDWDHGLADDPPKSRYCKPYTVRRCECSMSRSPANNSMFPVACNSKVSVNVAVTRIVDASPSKPNTLFETETHHAEARVENAAPEQYTRRDLLTQREIPGLVSGEIVHASIYL